MMMPSSRVCEIFTIRCFTRCGESKLSYRFDMVFFYVGNWMKREEEKKEGMGCLGCHFKPTNENPKGTFYLKSHVVWGSLLPFVCCIWCVDVSCGWDFKRIVDNLNWHILIRGHWNLVFKGGYLQQTTPDLLLGKEFFLILCFIIWQCSKSDSACCPFRSRQPSYLWNWIYRACKGKQN